MGPTDKPGHRDKLDLMMRVMSRSTGFVTLWDQRSIDQHRHFGRLPGKYGLKGPRVSQPPGGNPAIPRINGRLKGGDPFDPFDPSVTLSKSHVSSNPNHGFDLNLGMKVRKQSARLIASMRLGEEGRTRLR